MVNLLPQKFIIYNEELTNGIEPNFIRVMYNE
jgi:hypothetical protein